ncbi:MAG: exonuclease RecJ [Halobacteriales archaeon]|nr:exonuclease RecJ [Halobacteriales archaeon]
MATTDRPDAAPADAASGVAEALADAELACLVAPADADCLAAAGLLAAACRSAGVPYQASVARTADEVAARLAGADEAATTVVIGATADGGLALDPDGPVSPLAHRIAGELGATPDPVTALAGAVAAGAVPSQATPGLLEAAGLDREPGLAVPTAALADGLAHTTLVHAAFSGDAEATRTALDDVGLADADGADLAEAEARRAGSLVALAAAGAPDATPRAATAVERALRPYRTDGPFETLGGYADVLDALAERAPGLAVALVVGSNGRGDALEHWRARGRAAHAAVRDAATARHHGVLVARTDGPVATVARLLRDFRSPEPTVLAVGDGVAAAAATDAPVGEALAEAAAAAGGSALARGTRGTASFDPDRTERFVEAFREAR